MQVKRAGIRQRYTDAIFERGDNYRSEGRLGSLVRFGERLTAEVQDSQSYNVTVDFASAPFDATCTCPYDGPSICKHAVAVLTRMNGASRCMLMIELFAEDAGVVAELEETNDLLPKRDVHLGGQYSHTS